MKKVTSLAAALCMATAFCGFCSGCAAQIDKEAEPQAATPVVAESAVDAAKVILCPGWNYDGKTKKLNTIDGTKVTALTADQMGALDKEKNDAYWVENAYFCTCAVGEELPTPTAGKSGLTFVGWRQAIDGIPTVVKTMPATTETVVLYAQWSTGSTGGGGSSGGGGQEAPAGTYAVTLNGTNIYVKFNWTSSVTASNVKIHMWNSSGPITTWPGMTLSEFTNGTFTATGMVVSAGGDDTKTSDITIPTTLVANTTYVVTIAKTGAKMEAQS